MRTNSPKTLRDTCCSRPLPPQVGQVRDRRAGLGAVAAAARRTATATSNGTSRFAPVAASTSSISTRAAMSAPRARAAAPADAEQVVAEERGEEVGEAAEVERARLEAAAAQARVAEAVVELARLGVREHLVRLDDLAEALLGVRRLGDVGMQLAREPAEGALDLVGARVARDAEQLVVVALGRRHASSVAPASVVLVDLFDEARQLVRPRRAPSGSPCRSPSAPGPSRLTAPSVRFASPYAAPTSATSLQRRMLELVADADERPPRVERLAEHVEQRRALLERHEHVPVRAELLVAHVVEQPGRAADVEPLLARDRASVNAGRKRGEERALAAREARVLEARAGAGSCRAGARRRCSFRYSRRPLREPGVDRRRRT